MEINRLASYPLTRLKHTWPAVVLVAVVLSLLLRSLLAFNEPLGLGMRGIPLENGQTLVTWVMPAGNAWDAGLRPGMTVRSSPLPANSAAMIAFEVNSATFTGRTVLVSRPWSMAVDAALIIVGLEFLVAGLIVFLRASDRAAARRFFVVAGITSIVLVVTPAVLAGHIWAQYVQLAGIMADMAALAFFFLTTPVRRWWPLPRLVVGAAFCLVALYTFSVLVDPAFYEKLKGAVNIYFVTCMIACTAALAWPLITRSSPRQRFLWPVAVCSATATVIIAGSLLSYVLFHEYPLRPELAALSAGLLPIGFLWALLRHRLWGVNLGSWAMLRAVFDTIADPIFVVGRDGRLVDASQAGLKLLGLVRVRQADEPFARLISRWETPPTYDNAPVDLLIRRVLAGEVVRDEEHSLRLGGGAIVHTSVAGTPVLNERGEVDLVVLAYRDITERKRHEEELTYLSFHDSLTGLPNRRYLEDVLNRIIDRARRGDVSALLFIDVDNFKVVNDTLGHLAGDKMLATMVHLLRANLRSEDLLARVGGDEFAVLLDGTGPGDALATADRLRQTVSDFPFECDDLTFSLGLSIGVAPIDGQQDSPSVLAQADAAMYRAKSQNGNRVVVHAGDSELPRAKQ